MKYNLYDFLSPLLMDILFYTIVICVLLICISLIIGVLSFFNGAIAGAPFIPSSQKIVDEMVEAAGELQGKKVYDLGCGDGRIVFAASKKGAHAVGIEISFFTYTFALIRKHLTKSSGEIQRQSLWDTDLSDADVIFLYLLPQMMQRFEIEKMQTLKKGCKIISNGFAFQNTTPQDIKKLSTQTGRVLIYEV